MENSFLLWQDFAARNHLSEKQLRQFQDYYTLLIAANELFNITAITDLKEVLAYHFEDSIKLGAVLDMTKVSSLCDVGTGGGFPGIPLKILYPHIQVTLLEVTLKKVNFLNEVIEKLELENIETNSLDWRNFLRKSDTPIDLFCARASLRPDELVRMFAGSSAYQKSTLVYWASREWQPDAKETRHLKQCYPYHVGDRQRNYCIFSA
jgi:16S rRNA (guanine527-N7)-methyltransferase